MFRVGIDGVTEKDELKQRDADHHRERQPVAPHLDEFLRDNRAKPPPVEFVQFSRKIVLCRFHQADEHVFQPRFDLFPVDIRRSSMD